METRRLLAMALVLSLTGSAMAIQQQQLYKSDDLTAESVAGIQQHAVFLEMVVESSRDQTTLQQYAAVVGLVKACKEVRSTFDNAVLWFNDQFLFGNKSEVTKNATPPSAMGENPNRTHDNETLEAKNRRNGTGEWNESVGRYEKDEGGSIEATDVEGPAEGGNPDRNGFIRRQDMKERWGGCYIPNGFVHAIGTDDPYASGAATRAANENASAEQASDGRVADADHIEMTKALIDLDNTCGGCIFDYVGSFFITDPNNHRWVIDEFTYPLAMARVFQDDNTNCHAAVYGGPQDPAEDPENAADAAPDVIANKCSRELERPSTYGSSAEFQETDRPHQEGTKVTTKEVMLTVHLQVDPWNPDRQGFADEAVWAYQDGTQRLGMPYPDDPSDAMYETCKQKSNVTDSALEYDVLEREGKQGQGAAPNGDGRLEPSDEEKQAEGARAWADWRRGPVGTTVECAIEYNFLLTVFFESYDDAPGENVPGRRDQPRDVSGNGTGENEIIRKWKEHGNGSADAGDAAWQGNSHPHNPKTNETGPVHPHDALVLDLFFYERAPFFVEDNAYWDESGAPPRFKGVPRDNRFTEAERAETPVHRCVPVLSANQVQDQQERERVEAMEERRTIVCDPDAVDGFHLHDGTDTIGDQS